PLRRSEPSDDSSMLCREPVAPVRWAESLAERADSKHTAKVALYQLELHENKVQIPRLSPAASLQRGVQSCAPPAFRSACLLRPDKHLPIFRVADRYHSESRSLSNHSLRWPRRPRWL